MVIIDGLPGDTERTSLAIKAADFVLIPFQPSPVDVVAMDAVSKAAERLGTPWAFVLNRVRARSAVTAAGER